MDPRTIEINSLRVLNDYLNQTIDALVRTRGVGVNTIATGLSHTPFATTVGTPFGIGANYFAAQTLYTTLGALPFASAAMLDPTLRALSHTSAIGAWNPLAALTVPFARPWGVV